MVKQQVKTDATLPAYCDPPNPCPVGMTEEQGCTMDFENTASFSREYQAAQECMCDAEHMFECPASGGQDQNNGQQNFGSFLARQFPQEHKNLVAKKFHVKKVSRIILMFIQLLKIFHPYFLSHQIHIWMDQNCPLLQRKDSMSTKSAA